MNTGNKIQEGEIYTYKGEAVRLNRRIGVIGLLSRHKDRGFLGRIDLLKKANPVQVAKFLR